MWPFTERVQYPMPEAAKNILDAIPPYFQDDGLSCFPDSLFGFRFKWAGRIHDWGYCTRAHEAGFMTEDRKREMDRAIARHVASALPKRWKWIATLIRLALWRAGYPSFNSCGLKPYGASPSQLQRHRCRHNMHVPDWMAH